MGRLAIGEVARRSGLRPSALRYYEERGLLQPAARERGRRIYREEVLDRLAVIELAKRSGFTLGEIRALLAGLDRRGPAAAQWRAVAGARLAALDRRIEEARRMQALLRQLSDCPCPRLASCGRAFNAARGERDADAPRGTPTGRRRAQRRGANAA